MAVTKGVMKDSFAHETVDVLTEKNHLFVAKALARRSERLDRVNRYRKDHSIFEKFARVQEDLGAG